MPETFLGDVATRWRGIELSQGGGSEERKYPVFSLGDLISLFIMVAIYRIAS